MLVFEIYSHCIPAANTEVAQEVVSRLLSGGLSINDFVNDHVQANVHF